jgi:hypothetical protein
LERLFKGISVGRRRVLGTAEFPDLSKFRMLGLTCAICLGLTLTFLPVRHAQAETSCPIPDGLALRDIALPAARQQATSDHRLVILTFGGVHPAGADTETRDTTFPGRLEAALGAALPGIEVTVKNEAPPGKTSADVAAALPELITKTGAKLVIWGPGGRDVMARIGIEVFRTSVNAGIEAVRGAGADLILLDTTFIPAPARMAAIEAYRDRLLAAAVANHVPMLRRHALMRLWSEDGTLDLAANDPAEREVIARHLFSCVAQGLAAPIAAAVR